MGCGALLRQPQLVRAHQMLYGQTSRRQGADSRVCRCSSRVPPPIFVSVPTLGSCDRQMGLSLLGVVVPRWSNLDSEVTTVCPAECEAPRSLFRGTPTARSR